VPWVENCTFVYVARIRRACVIDEWGTRAAAFCSNARIRTRPGISERGRARDNDMDDRRWPEAMEIELLLLLPFLLSLSLARCLFMIFVCRLRMMLDLHAHVCVYVEFAKCGLSKR
jgi:hypothetical protein